MLIETVVWTSLWSAIGWLYGYRLHTHAWQAAGVVGTLFGLLGGLAFSVLRLAWTARRGPPSMGTAVGLGALAAELAVVPVIYLTSRTFLLPPRASSIVLGAGAVTGVLSFFVRRRTGREPAKR